jgi:uncharacterized protein involved in outer membrane biogenesis
VGQRIGQEVRHPSSATLKWSGAIAVLLIGLAVLIAIWDWNWFKGPISRYASARTGREVRIVGDLDVKPWSWTPQVTADGLTIGHPKWMAKGHTAEVRRLTVRFKLVPAMMGRTELPLVYLDRPKFDLLKDKDGRVNWKLDRRDKSPTRLPPINNLIVRDGQIHFVDQKKRLTIDGTVNASESSTGQGEGFKLVGKGTVNANPFTLLVTGGPLIHVERGKPYHFTADVRAGATHLNMKANLPKPFDLGLVNADFTIGGADLADVYYLTGAGLPSTPPYHLAGRFERDAEIYDFPHFAGRVGDSDLSGRAKMDATGKRPMLTAKLVSRSLDFDDLATVIGGAPAVGPGETASPEQVALARRMRGRLLPDAPLDLQRLRSMDAKVSFRATSVRTRRIPLRQVAFHLDLDNGLLLVDPLSFDFPRGRIAGMVRLNGRGATPVTDVDLKLSNLGLEYLMRPVRGSVPVTGTLVGRARLHGAGNSVRRAAAASNGSLSFAVPGGQIREAFAELMGINVAPGLFKLLNKDQDRTNLRCAVGHFDVSGGVARGTRIVIDTKPVLVQGQGQINLANETIDIRLKGKNKKPRILHIMAPIRVSGTLTHPQVKAELAKAAPQAGIAVALGALVSPLAAILPFIDPGLAKDANCSALMSGG